MKAPASFTAPLLGIDELRRQGRAPRLPFQVRVESARGNGGDAPPGGELVIGRLLRVLPGKRLVGEGEWRGRRVLAKLFVAAGSQRHWRRERAGVKALLRAGIPTPPVVAAGSLGGDGYVLMTEFLADAVSLAERWENCASLPAGDERALAVLRPAFVLLGRLHAAGLVQTDLHLGNFLECAGELYVIDGDGVERIGGRPLRPARQTLDNLALLIAQLPPAWEERMEPLLAAYAAGRRAPPPVLAELAWSVIRVREERLAHFLAKTLRDCSQFAVRRTPSLFSSVLRSEKDALADWLDYPDAALDEGLLLKDGNTCTVARARTDGREVVVKRYNLKNFTHALSRLWRPSRAWHAWLAAHRLAFHGIATPAPLAIREERVGPLRRRAFLFTEFCPGSNLLEHLDPAKAPGAEEAAALRELFTTLLRLRITHGDCKASNFLWYRGRLFLIDLDAMVRHRSARALARAWRRDRARFLRNWPSDSLLHRWLDENLPEAP